MAERFTAEDFEALYRSWRKAHLLGREAELHVAAFRIAAAVMRPGVIEAAIGTFWETDGRADLSDEAEAEIVRKALTDGL